jgi:diamine N-acetyltransferase
MNERFSKTISSFEFQTITLSLLRHSDLLETLNWRNNYRTWFNDSNVISLQEHLAWFKQYQQKNNDFVFIARNTDQERVGQVSVYNIDWKEKHAEFGRVLVNPVFAGQKYMKKSCEALLHFCQNCLELRYLHLAVKANNKKAIYLYQNLGFTMLNAHEALKILHFGKRLSEPILVT